MPRALAVLTGATYLARATILAVNALTVPRLRPAGRRAVRPTVSLLVPARREAETLPRLLPILMAQGADEVVVYDDGDNGDAIDLARSLGARVITGPPPPPSFIGKSWACHQLAKAARGELMVFTDADTHWREGTLDAIVAHAATGTDMVSVVPRPEGLTWGARTLTPLVDNVVLTHVPLPLLAVPHRLCATAHGALIAVTREAYDRSGGHEGVYDQIMEDVMLARAVKGSGGTVRLVLGDELLGITMYGSFREAVSGFSKNVVAVHNGSRVATVGSVVLYAITHTLPWLVEPTPAVCALRAASVLDRAVVNVVDARRSPADLAEGLLGPITPVLSLPVLAKAFRRTVSWKGRSYDRSASSRIHRRSDAG